MRNARQEQRALNHRAIRGLIIISIALSCLTSCGSGEDKVRVAAEEKTRETVGVVADLFAEVLARHSIKNVDAAVQEFQIHEDEGNPIWFIIRSKTQGSHVEIDVAVYGYATGTDNSGNPFANEYVEQCVRLTGSVGSETPPRAPVTINCTPLPATKVGVPQSSLVVATLGP